jgi:dUTP pyrophosphatase
MIPKIKLLSEFAKWPDKAYEGDGGYDVFSNSPTIILGFGERFKFQLGFAIELPPGWVALIQEKSGMAVNNGILTMGNVIDSTYRGECHAILCCLNDKPVEINHGQKIAQMLIVPCYSDKYYVMVAQDEELSISSRRDKGFGSTGLR